MPLPEPVPDIRSLDLLRSVAELGSIRQAALRHGISQPAASVRLRALEGILNVELLDRSRGRAQLTSAGVAVVQWAGNVLEQMRELVLATQALEVAGHTHLRIAASLTVAEYLVPGWLSHLRSSDPELIVSLEMGNSHHVVQVIESGGADLGFVEGVHAPRALTSRVVQSDDLVVVVAPSHPWARRRLTVAASDLAATPLVVREPGSGTREVLDDALAAHGLSVNVQVELASTTAIKSAVASGAGPGILSKLAVESEVREGRLVAVEVADLPLERRVRAVWFKSVALSASARRLMRQINASSVPGS
ncbi:MAG: LysR family transcriptional regulator [Acidimicrobiaceae bacterium]|nr:LysR family transcriptional regulator [Acidimicrobiaceae bacterium]